MLKNFDIEFNGHKFMGYNYEVENPKHVCVLIHGIGEHLGRYKRVAEYFEKNGIAIVGMDLRGHGKTEGKRGHCAPRVDVLKDIDCLIDYTKELYPNVPIILYGHSMGGGLVCDYRARGTYNGLVQDYLITSPWLMLVKSFPMPIVEILGKFAKLNPDFKISSSCEEEDLGNPEFVRPYKDDELVHPYISLQTAYEGFKIGSNIAKGKHEDNGKGKNIPTLIMHGSLDKICDVNGTRSYANLNSSYDTFEYKEWEGYYHEIHNGGPNGLTGEEPIKKMIEFINGI